MLEILRSHYICALNARAHTRTGPEAALTILQSTRCFHTRTPGTAQPPVRAHSRRWAACGPSPYTCWLLLVPFPSCFLSPPPRIGAVRGLGRCTGRGQGSFSYWCFGVAHLLSSTWQPPAAWVRLLDTLTGLCPAYSHIRSRRHTPTCWPVHRLHRSAAHVCRSAAAHGAQPCCCSGWQGRCQLVLPLPTPGSKAPWLKSNNWHSD